MPYPSAPLPDTVSASGSCRILRSPCPVWCSGAGAGTPLCDSERTEGGGNPSEEPGEEGEADDPGPEPAKASASVVGGGGGPAAPPSRSAYSPRPRPWQPGEEAAIVSEPAPERGAQRREIPGKETARDRRGPGPGGRVGPERRPRILWRRTAPATTRPAFPRPALDGVCAGRGLGGRPLREKWRSGSCGGGRPGSPPGRGRGGVRALCRAGGSGRRGLLRALMLQRGLLGPGSCVLSLLAGASLMPKSPVCAVGLAVSAEGELRGSVTWINLYPKA